MLNDIKAMNDAGERALDLKGFDYGAPAELFPSRGRKNRGNLTYKRFSTAAEGLRFAVEELPMSGLIGACLEVDEARFGYQEMRALYENAAYPLLRRTTAD